MADLPAEVERSLATFVEAAQEAFGDQLISIILFGSAAEGRLRPTSDVNVIVVLRAFDPDRAARLGAPYRTAAAAIRLEAMFVLRDELAAVMDAFAVKFADVLRRRRVLFGPDPFADLRPSRQAEILRVRQVLLNLTLRLRGRSLVYGTREEQMILAIADAAGPLRAAAAALLELEGRHVDSGKTALASLAAALPDGPWDDLLAALSTARETLTVPAGTAARALARLSQLAGLLAQRAAALSA
jgi:predicted nucleotidyltransferase